ncbi:hypothetical protein PC129_g2641 [Phytophthora cactorum]|uniref:Uncharacterized protein n=1 Tax=Phytophthora cactorum TaxID=29920 RepID=A0A329ST99_9STRA|nr:hypothetical protein Pcac1_g10225 [Phytophthora cactorum]KAG2840221.1 hypothetical protein PC111_g3564 [Phytophthora cactorum]KAG2846550.1 hypothetical protein PC112_g1446 [Phytophthora cactorum]KAG2868819.1 hypothetical protein PC113_g737 [Phytophthora cactorum]KAG2928644.1 hypothetical protein PC114_g3051 [Phytophthora cactorum]
MDGMDGREAVSVRNLPWKAENELRTASVARKRNNGSREDSESAYRCWLRGLTGGRTSKKSTTTSAYGIWTVSDEWKAGRLAPECVRLCEGGACVFAVPK